MLFLARDISFRCGPTRLACILPLFLPPTAVAQSRWREVDLLPRVLASGLTYDATRDRVVLFCSADAGTASATWLHDGSAWGSAWQRVRPTANPPPMLGPGLAFDSQRSEAVLFGTIDGRTHPGETWLWNGTDWRQAGAGSPPARERHALAFDPRRGRTVLFGGGVYPNGYFTPGSDTWEWDGSTWTQSAASGPSPRYDTALAFDPALGRLVLFGGVDSSGPLNDTWTFDGTTWQRLSPTTTPPAGDSPHLVTDSNGGRLILLDASAPQTVYELRGGNWVAQTTAAAPTPRLLDGVTFVDSSARTLVVGGWDSTSHEVSGATLALTGRTWSTLHATAVPPNSQGLGAAMAYDAGRGRCVRVCPGASGTADVRVAEFDGTVWHLPSPSTSPSVRFAFAFAYDELRQQCVLFGGNTGGLQRVSDETWLWDGTAWSRATPVQSPPARDAAGMTFDRGRGRIILCGGIGTTQGLTDTWEWDGNNWQRAATNAPASTGPLAYDVHRARTVMVGSTGALLQTWEWDGTTWQQRQPNQSPPVRAVYALYYDEVTARVVLTGGRQAGVLLGDTWDWDGNDWRLRDTGLAPRAAPAVAFDRQRGRAVLFGGSRVGTFEFDDTEERFSDQVATYVAFGQGCTGSAGAPRLAAGGDARPWLADTLQIDVDTLPAAAVAAVFSLGASDQTWFGLPLPFSLAGLGMPGCALYTGLDVTLPVPASAARASLRLQLCDCPRLAGQRFFNQAFVLDVGANARGILVSNGGAATIGRR